MTYYDEDNFGHGYEVDHGKWAVLWPLLICAAIVLAGVFAGSAWGQTYTITTPTGSITQPLQSGGGESLEVRHRNGQNPDAWGQGGLLVGQPVPFYSWEVDAPGKTLLMGGLFGASQTGPGRFLIARPDQYKMPARRNGVDLWPATAAYHRIFPGDTLYARLAPADDPWELRYLATITPERKALALEIMAFDEARIANWPWLRRTMGLFTYDASSFNPNTPAGSRNCGYMLIPRNFLKVWPHYVAGLPAVQHWYGLGSRSAVAGENLNNEHYGCAAAWIGMGLRKDDPAALTVGFYLQRHQDAYGVIDCDSTASPFRGLYRNEKGDLARGTTGTRPSRAKEFGLGAAMMKALVDEPMHDKTVALLVESLLLPGWAWTGYGGARGLGHYLENLRHYFILSGEDRFRARAELEINHAMGIVGTKLWFPENNDNRVSGGEGVCSLAACRWWALHGAGAQHQAKLDQMLAWYEAHLEVNGVVAYYATVNADGTVTWQANGGWGALNWLHIPGLSTATRSAIETVAFTKYANTPTWDAAYGGEGPGLEKWLPWLVCWGATTLGP